MYVFIREAPPTEYLPCLSPSGYLCAASRIQFEHEEFHFDFDATVSSTTLSLEMISKFDKCGLSSCSLFEQGCLTANSATSKVSIGTTSPWDLLFPLNVVVGWDETKCVKCLSFAGFDLILDKIRIKQF